MATTYVSCIRINGRPILPPLLDEERRNLVRQMKDRAVALEKRIGVQRKRRDALRLFERSQPVLEANIPPEVSRQGTIAPPANVSRSLLLFDGDRERPQQSRSLPTSPRQPRVPIEELFQHFLQLRSVVEGLSKTVDDSSKRMHDLSKTVVDSVKAVVASHGQSPCTSDASSDTQDEVFPTSNSSQNLDDESKTLDNSPRTTDSSPKTSDSSARSLEDNVSKAANAKALQPSPRTFSDSVDDSVSTDLGPYMQAPVTDGETTDTLECSTPVKPLEPRVRRLSYTLEAPSPVLLKQMRQAQASPSAIKQEPTKTSTAGALEDFLRQQELLMQQLLAQQAQEQQRLAALFRQQEAQLMAQLRSSASRPASRRSLQSSFDAAQQPPQPALPPPPPTPPLPSPFSPKISARLAALVRGYLTRRLLATDQVRDQLQTIRDTRACLRELDRGSLKVLPCDVELHKRLLQQLAAAEQQLHHLVLKPDAVAARMSAIRRDREKKLAASLSSRPRSRSLSSATVKSLERKQTLTSSSSSRRGSTTPESAASASHRRDARQRPWSVSSFNSVASASSGSTFRRQVTNDKSRKPWRC